MRPICTVILLLVASIAQTLFAQSVVDEANAAYADKNYEEAVKLYEQILADNGASVTVYYNLGNAYYRLNRIAPAILNYERALLLDPADKDVRYNLAFVQSKTVDKIEPVDEFFLTTVFNAIKNRYSANRWAGTAIATFIAFIVGMFVFFFARRIALKKIGFYFGLLFLTGAVFANIFAYRQKKELTVRHTAIIFAPTTTIKSTPDVSGTDLFILHEGTKVDIKNRLGDWNEIETADGNVGWIASDELEII
ncbi:MAG: tetratricopeptide repeat protein [Candidatus Symbiothrix sp.]|nr:tetratricopeptide repeat protein [Candidatus Symbiothrix sp.]